jgi:hypothetical protein
MAVNDAMLLVGTKSVSKSVSMVSLQVDRQS